MNIFYFFIITLSSAKCFPSELEENDLSRTPNLSPDIRTEPEDCVDMIQGELKEQKTVFTKMMSNIKDEMTAMKKCLLSGEENIADSISACSAALEQSIQEALVWATPPKEDHAGVKDPGENHKCQDFTYLTMIAFLFDRD